jgi:hypothetical protein
MVTALLDNLPKLVEAGLELIKGIAKGIIDNAPRLLGEAAAAIGNTLTNGVKSVFRIQSPSRVFMDIGENVISGLEHGITDNLRMLENASMGISSTVTGTVETGFSGMTAPVPLTSASNEASAGSTYNITVNAGVGTDPVSVGREVVNAIKRYESVSGKVFVSA